jgi:hypothetical protein
MKYGRTGVAAIRRASQTTGKLLVATINTRLFSGDLLFVPGGYKLVASELGQQRGLRAASRFAPQVTRDSFRGQWISHRRQMAGMNATTRDRRSSTEG